MEFSDGIYYLIDPADPAFSAENALEFQPGKWDANFEIYGRNDEYDAYLKLKIKGAPEIGLKQSISGQKWNKSYSSILIHEEDIHLWPNRRVYDIEDTLKGIRGNKHDILLLETDLEENIAVDFGYRDRPTYIEFYLIPYNDYINHGHINIEEIDSDPTRLIYQLLRDKDVSFAVSPMIIAISNVLTKNKNPAPEIPGLEKQPLYT